MEPRKQIPRRWQFSLGALFGTVTAAALLAAATSGAFGAATRDRMWQFATILVVVGVGIFYYTLIVLVLCTPLAAVGWGLKRLARAIRRPTRAAGSEENDV